MWPEHLDHLAGTEYKNKEIDDVLNEFQFVTFNYIKIKNKYTWQFRMEKEKKVLKILDGKNPFFIGQNV